MKDTWEQLEHLLALSHARDDLIAVHLETTTDGPWKGQMRFWRNDGDSGEWLSSCGTARAALQECMTDFLADQLDYYETT